jgi:hypothetical protein
MAYFQTRIPNLGKFWRVLQWKMLVYFMAIWPTVRPFGIFCDRLEYLRAIYYIFTISRFGILYQEKSGNPAFQDWRIRMK